MKWKKDCKYFRGEYVCDYIKLNNQESCELCNQYNPYTKKILIIKLGSMGDVLRTTCLLPALIEKFVTPKIYWLVNKESEELLLNNPYTDKILIYNKNSLLQLKHEKFDILYSLDHSLPGSAIANEIIAEEKYGFYFDSSGNPHGYNDAAISYLETAWSDVINRKDRRTYQQILFEIAEILYKGQEYSLKLKEEEKWYALDFLANNNLSQQDKFIGINIGSASRWKSKSWHKEEVLKLIRMISKTNYKILLLGGPNEVDLQKEYLNELEKKNIKVYPNNPNNSLREFMSIVSLCNIIITGDSLAMHIATALKKRVIALFFCTPPWMIEDYGRITKVVSHLLENNLYTDEDSEELSRGIEAEEVFNLLKE